MNLHPEQPHCRGLWWPRKGNEPHDLKKPQIRLVIAADHPVFRDGLRRLLEAEPNHKVIGEAPDGAEGVRLTRELKPDILLLDLAMSKHPGLEALRELNTPGNASDPANGCNREESDCRSSSTTETPRDRTQGLPDPSVVKSYTNGHGGRVLAGPGNRAVKA